MKVVSPSCDAPPDSTRRPPAHTIPSRGWPVDVAGQSPHAARPSRYAQWPRRVSCTHLHTRTEVPLPRPRPAPLDARVEAGQRQRSGQSPRAARPSRCARRPRRASCARPTCTRAQKRPGPCPRLAPLARRGWPEVTGWPEPARCKHSSSSRLRRSKRVCQQPAGPSRLRRSKGAAFWPTPAECRRCRARSSNAFGKPSRGHRDFD